MHGEKHLVFTEKEVLLFSSKRKHSNIWDKFLKIQRKHFVEQLSCKIKRMLVNTRI